ncbi:MAG: sigma-70 family RNA polymerase sigma factor [Planctomycetota bacterium]
MSAPPEDHPLATTASLIVRAKAGEPAARHELVVRYQEQLLRCLHGRLNPGARSLQETRDMAQEALTACIRRLGDFEYRGLGTFWSYLRRIGINMVNQANRRGAIHPLQNEASAHLNGAASAGGSPSEILQGREAGAAFEQALERIPEPARSALLLRIELDLPYQVIAEDCGYPTADAARMSICRALEQLARDLAAFGP